MGKAIATAAAVLILALGNGAACAAIKTVTITPKYETAGVIIETEEERVGLELWDGRAFRKAHPFVRFDAHHMASSLFGLKPDTRYRIRVGGTIEKEFRTLREFVLPEPKKVIEAPDMAALQAAVSTATPGTEIRLKPGGVYRGMVLITRSGRPGAPIVLRGLIGHETDVPIHRRKGLPVIEAAGEESGIEIRDAAYVVLDGIRVQHAEKHGVYLRRAAHCVVQNMQIYDNGNWNLIISKGGEAAGRHLIQGNHVADREHKRFTFTYKRDPDVTYYGIQQDNQGGWGTTIRNNIVEGHVDGIMSSGDEHSLKHIQESDPDVLARFVNREVDIYGNIVVNQRDDAIEADGVCVNQRVFRNYFGRSQNATSISPSGPGPFFFVKNVMEGYREGGAKLNTGWGRGLIRNAFYYHNTFVAADDNRVGVLAIWRGTPSKNIVFRNNIFIGRLRAISFQGLAHVLDMDYDLWDAPATGDARRKFAEAGVPWEEHGLFGPAGLGRTLVPEKGSRAVDSAVRLPGVNDTYAGAGPDRGALERGEADDRMIRAISIGRARRHK